MLDQSTTIDFRKTRVDPITRFWSKVDKSGECWEWTGGILVSGYGNFSWRPANTKRRQAGLAHRFSYEIVHGPIPKGLLVCHHCDNRTCVRPDHLFLGTILDNNRDMDRKGRSRRLGVSGTANPNAVLTESQVIEIRSLLAKGHTQKSVGLAFHVSERTIGLIHRRQAWRQVS